MAGRCANDEGAGAQLVEQAQFFGHGPGREFLTEGPFAFEHALEIEAHGTRERVGIARDFISRREP